MSVFALLERLAPHIEKELNLVINSKQEADTLSSRLKKILVGLQDAEKKGVTNASIKDWLKELEDVTYEMDDVLDEWQTTNIQLQVEGSQNFSDPWEKVRSLFLLLCFCFQHMVDRRQITLKMKSLSERLDKILLEKNKYNFVSSESDHALEFRQLESISIVDKSKIYGRNDEKDSLVKQLVSMGEENSEYTQIVSIVGVGGVGKTTLAQLAYNDPELENEFELKAWVSVSDPFDASVVARAILEGFGQSLGDIRKLETLVQHVWKLVKDKKFLLVLDDMWTEDRMKWECLKNCLRGKRGSKILVTTRSELVARMMGTSQLQQLNLLSDLQCWKILNGIALHGRTKDECEELRDVGMEVAKKCNGLPLAARTVGSMLALRFTKKEWQDVLRSPLWKYEDEITDLFRLLKLSYIDLSPLLKQCFLSCIVYPKGSPVNVDKQIRIWMAYGYLSSSGGAGEVHLKGLNYFQKLAMRSFLQKLENDAGDEDEISYKVHDIMHDFANYLSRSERNFIIDGGLDKGRSLPSQRVHYNILLNSFEKIRTFCVRDVSQEELPLNLVPHLKRVRVLIISDCNLLQLPQDTGKLIHLRYLDVSSNPIQELPETLSNLYNLQTLDVENCSMLSRLPEGIGKLNNLRHLLNSGTHNLKQFPQGLKKLTNLWTLSEFRASGAHELAYLRDLNQLQGSLCIFLLEINDTVDGLEEDAKSILKNKNQLQKLELYFYGEELTNNITDVLQPPPNLQTLVTHGRWDKWISHWIPTSFNNLKLLEFDGLKKCSDLPPFGKLAVLEKLLINNCGFKCLRKEFLGIEDVVADTKAQSILASSEGDAWFPRLKKLQFKHCGSWEEWEDIGEEAQGSTPILPYLEELEIRNCCNWRTFPAKSLPNVNWKRVSEQNQMSILRDNIRASFLAYTSVLRFIDKVKGRMD